MIDEVLAIVLELFVVSSRVLKPGGVPFFGGLLGELGVDKLGMID